MASPILPNTSNFLGVALVVNRSRDGPQFVFHYPQRIPSQPAAHPSSCPKPADQGGDDDGDDGGDPEGGNDDLLELMSSAPFGDSSVDLRNWNQDDHLETDSGSHIVPWEHVAGYPTKDLESLLTPARAFHKKQFHVALDQLYCLSYPVFVPESGVWKKRKRRQPKQSQAPRSAADDPETASASRSAAEPPRTPAQAPTVEIKEPTHDHSEDPAEEKKSGMTMFNLVFILNPKRHEAKELADTLHFHIIKKINKAYKYSQEKSDFVWKESKKILALKDKGREAKTRMSILWKDILTASSLAASMQDVYEAVSHNRIAALQLDTPEGALTHSVQIPMPFYLADLPADDDDGSKGLWITTANNFVVEDKLDDPVFLDKNFALLPITDEKKIIAELQADPDETSAAMVEFVRLSKPTMSFHHISQGNGLSPAQVRKYAQHFIFWRRAIAIPPLHPRDVYIVSPNCNTDLLPEASRNWAKAFPLAPPLPDFLADLSAAPRAYKWHSPTKSHRPTYLQMLAWLMRGGWVTQLCTFAYVVVWPEILYEVQYRLEADELRAADASSSAAAATATASRVASPGAEGSLGAGARAGDEGSIDATGESDAGDNSRATSPSVGLEQERQYEDDASSAVTSSSSSSSSTDRQHTTLGEQVAEKARLERIADKARREAAEKAAAHARKQVPVATDHPSVNDAPHLARLAPYIIVDAKKATGKDSLYLSAIGRRFRDPKVQRAWPVFWKYFNGRSALERVALQEDLKRKETWNLLTAMSEYLITVRHW